MDKKLKNMKANRIIFLVFGIIFALLGFFMFGFFIVGGILLFLAYATNKKYKELLNETEVKPDTVSVPESVPVSRVAEINEEINSKYIFFKFKVAGVTFKDGRKTRQATLRAFKWGDEEIEYSDFELYEYEGKPAVYVKINDKIVGNVPAVKVSEFLELESNHQRDNIHADVYGGSKLDDGSRTNYGCEITVRYLK